ncbi:MAG: glycosyltransferase family 4 protein [Patescibacteria group bacterium]
MKKTLLVTIDFLPQSGGVARYLANLAANLPRESLVVLAPKIKNYHDDISSCKIYRRSLFWAFWPKWLPMLWHIYKIIKTEKIEIIWVAQPLPVGTAVYLVSRLLKLPYIVNSHGMDVALILYSNTRKKLLGKRILNNANQVTVNSNFTKNLILELGVPENKITKIYPCPAFHQLPSQHDCQKIKQKYNLENKKIILTVGRLVKRKGHDQVIRALPKILATVPETAYLIVGDGQNKENLLELTKQLDLEENVLFTGFITDQELPAYYQIADLFIMPSRNINNYDVEGFGLVYLEANSFGKPTISGDQGGEAEAVVNGQTGFQINPTDITKISEQVVSLLTNNDLTEKIGEQGRRWAKNFSWEIEAKKLEKLLSE